MIKLLTFLLVMMCLQTMAQRPTVVVKPTQVPIGKPVINPNSVPVTAPDNPAYKVELTPAQMKEQSKKAEMIKDAALIAKEAAAKEACYQKIDPATITRIEVKFENIPISIPSLQAVFDDMNVVISKYGSLNMSAKITGNPLRWVHSAQISNKKNEENFKYYFDETYSFIPSKTTTYKDLLDNGFTFSLLLAGHKEWDFNCSIHVFFYYSNIGMAFSDVYVTPLGMSSKKGMDASVTKFISGGKELRYKGDPCGDWRPSW
jgi:hypothetical protein